MAEADTWKLDLRHSSLPFCEEASVDRGPGTRSVTGTQTQERTLALNL